MVTTRSVTRFLRQFRLLPKTVIWLQKQPNAAFAIEQLVAKAEAEEQNALIAARGRSVAEEELEICYEQIATLKEQLKYQEMESLEYLQEIEHSQQELQGYNQELVNLQQKLLNLNSDKVRESALYRLAFRRGDIMRDIIGA